MLFDPFGPAGESERALDWEWVFGVGRDSTGEGTENDEVPEKSDEKELLALKLLLWLWLAAVGNKVTGGFGT